jgi:hypothetical protein
MVRHRDLKWRDVLKIASTTAFCAAALLVFQLGGASAASAKASPCKGLKEADCKANAACAWVKATKPKAAPKAPAKPKSEAE